MQRSPYSKTPKECVSFRGLTRIYENILYSLDIVFSTVIYMHTACLKVGLARVRVYRVIHIRVYRDRLDYSRTDHRIEWKFWHYSIKIFSRFMTYNQAGDVIISGVVTLSTYFLI